MDISLLLTILGLLIGLPSFFKFIKTVDLYSYKFSTLPNEEKILIYIRDYPEKYHQVWAVKESQILLGNLIKAKKNPGLGWTFLTLEFINKYCKSLGKHKMKNAISFIIEKTQDEDPYFYLYEITNEITTRTIKTPDFRHSIAFGITLSLFEGCLDNKKRFINSYFNFIVNHQQKEGGWQAGDGSTTSELFSTLYALKFLFLNKNKFKNINDYEKIINKSLKWLLRRKSNENLWSSGIFKQYYWDQIITTAWVFIHIFDIIKNRKEWIDLYNKSSIAILKSLNTINWNNINELERFRIEARIAAFFYNGLMQNIYERNNKIKIEAFLNNWKFRSRKILRTIKLDDFDLGTAILIAEPLIGNERLLKKAQEICK